jgi:pimeloyl-ACP methyl ester carboxylesterase
MATAARRSEKREGGRAEVKQQLEKFDVNGVTLEADVITTPAATGVVLFVHGSGSSRHSSRNQSVARVLQQRGFDTVLMDLLTPEEEQADRFTGHLRFDIEFLARRVVGVVYQLRDGSKLPFGLFGASTGAAAALATAAARPDDIAAIVSRGGRPDLAGAALPMVVAPTLLIVGGADREVLELNRQARQAMTRARDVRLEIVPGASHLFEEPGALEQVAGLAGDWFTLHLKGEA